LSNGNGASKWKDVTQFGILGFLVLHLLGAIPGVPSPIDKAMASMDKNIQTLVAAMNSREDKIVQLIGAISECQKRGKE
jgi:hypothetical protein